MNQINDNNNKSLLTFILNKLNLKDYQTLKKENNTNFEELKLQQEENQKLYKYVLKEETGKLVVNLHQNRIVTRVTIDIMVFTGDVIFTAQEQEGVTIKQNYLSNKVLFEVILAREKLEDEEEINKENTKTKKFCKTHKDKKITTNLFK